MSDSRRLTGIWETRERNPLIGAFLLIFAIGAVYFIVQAVLLNGVITIDTVRDPDGAGEVYERYQWLILGVLAATQYGLLLLLSLLIIRRWHTRQLVRYLTLDRLSVPGLIATTVGAVTLLPLVDLLARYLYSLIPGLESLDTGMGSLLTADTLGGQLFIYFAVAVTPAVCEEVLFRAYFQRTLERRIRAPWHFLISGAVFALFHQQVLTLPSLVLVGVFLSYMYFAFQSPWVTIAAHFAYNGIQIFLVNYNRPIPGIITEAGFTPAALIAGTTIAAATVVFAEASRRRAGAGDTRAVSATDAAPPVYPPPQAPES